MTISFKRRQRRLRGALLVALAMVLTLLPATMANAQQGPCDETDNGRTYRRMLDCVTIEGVMEHLGAFQAIADANGGNRAAATPGYDASVDYVIEKLEAAGWQAERFAFDMDLVEVVLQQLTPIAANYGTLDVTGAGEGDVTGPVKPVDINLTLPRANSSGCEAADFAGIDWSGANDIALIQRGTCPFADKAINAEAAGAEAVVIFNQGDQPNADRSGLFAGTLGAPDVVDIPVVSASYFDGEALAAAGSTARVVLEAEQVTTHNVIADLPGRFDDNIVMAGAHLDSVPPGPGINDNGSGSAALLEVAEQLGRHRPNNSVRFAWWGAEELGLIGSWEWVDAQSQEELDNIALYLNFDMVGSPNYIFMTYDGDESGWPAPVAVPPGSAAIEKVFESFYTMVDVPYDDAEFSGRSDYQAFILNGIPAGGLFTGAEVRKTPLQQSIWGGVANESYDQCYHQACDTLANVNQFAEEINADAIAFAVLTFAHTTESVNGVVGKSIPSRGFMPTPNGPEGTVNLP